MAHEYHLKVRRGIVSIGGTEVPPPKTKSERGVRIGGTEVPPQSQKWESVSAAHEYHLKVIQSS